MHTANGHRTKRDGQPVLTRANLQWVAHRLPAGAASLELRVVRAGEAKTLPLELADGWKACDPREYAWRPFKWNLTPGPGFGGKPLDAEAKKKLGLAPDAWAQTVEYIVTWGEKSATGKSAQAAGLKKGDVLLSVAGESHFDGEDHFQAWFRMTRKAGTAIELVILRAGERRTLEMTVVE